MTRRQSPTLKDVAKEAGVSVMTVSVALSGKSCHVRISDKTRKHVEETARRLHYQPNAIARSLRSNRTNTYGFYSAYPYLSVDNPYIHHIISGLMDGCDNCEKELLIFGDYYGKPVEEVLSRIGDRRIDGLTVWAPPEGPLGDALLESGMPTISIDSRLATTRPNTEGIAYVVADDERGIRSMLDYLMNKGHRRFAYVTIGYPSTSQSIRLETVRRYPENHDMELTIFNNEHWLETWLEGCSVTWLDEIIAKWSDIPQKSRSTVFVCWCDHLAYAMLARCRRHNLRVPEDVSITGFDGLPPTLTLNGNLTTVSVPWHDVGKRTIELLEDKIAGRSVPIQTIMPFSIQVGDTA